MASSSYVATTCAVRRADTGCVVYIDTGAMPTGVSHRQEKCPCVKTHGPEEFDLIDEAVRNLLGSQIKGKSAVFDGKASVEVALFLLGAGSKKTRAWNRDL